MSVSFDSNDGIVVAGVDDFLRERLVDLGTGVAIDTGSDVNSGELKADRGADLHSGEMEGL